MLQSPSKRRRIESAADRSKEVQTTEIDALPPKTTPRASYRSPTKSSLARSHPHLVKRYSRNAQTGSRGRLLRDELLKQKDDNSEPRKPEGVFSESSSIHQHPTSDKQTTIEEPDASERLSNVRARSPLTENPPRQVAGRSATADSEDSPPVPITPTLVRRRDKPSTPVSRPRSNEPDLPPTPVQLGLDPVPDRPRGLASSSSPSSRLEIGNRSHGRGMNKTITDSPLKNKTFALVSEAPETTQPLMEEAGESEPDQHASEGQIAPDEEQRSRLVSLQQKAKQLQQENSKLEVLLASDMDLDVAFFTQMVCSDLSSGNKAGPLPLNLGDKPLAHLTLFAPGNIQLISHSETRQVDERTKIVHSLTVASPPPWPRHLLDCVFEVTVDAQDARIEQVQMTRGISKCATRQQDLSRIGKWIDQRLTMSLHRLDVGGVIWGIGQWFAVTIERARVFKWLDQHYNRHTPIHVAKGNLESSALTRESALELSRYMRMQHIELNGSSQVTSKVNPVKLMLIWDIDLDWTGNASSNPTVAISGVPARAEHSLKEVFRELVTSRGVIDAFQSVFSLVSQEHSNEVLVAV